MLDYIEGIAKPPRPQQRVNYRFQHQTRQTAQKWNRRRAEDKQRRSNGHQDQMLRHVRGEQQIIQCIDGGSNRDPKGGDAE